MSWVKSRDGKVAVNLAQVTSLEVGQVSNSKHGWVLRAFGSTSPHEGVALASGMTEDGAGALLELLMEHGAARSGTGLLFLDNLAKEA